MLVATSIAALALAGAAGATIVPQSGMAGVQLGMTKAQVKGVLGKPSRIVHGTNDFGSYTEFGYPYRLVVTFQGNANVSGIATTGVHERTANGAGVGSTEGRLRIRVPHLTCESVTSSFRHCFLGQFIAGHRVTDFRIGRGKVTRVTIGFVID